MPRKIPSRPDGRYDDFIQPFLIDHSAIRGRLVRLGKVLNTVLKAHRYPDAVSIHLAEQMVIAGLLSATLSGDGILTVQAKGDGPVRLLVTDVMAGGVVRAYAQINGTVLNKEKQDPQSLPHILGKGYLAVTYDRGKDADRYQGIVELKGETLTEAFEGYFRQSQQGEIAVHVVVRAPDKHHKHWAAGGIIIERMPVAGGKEPEYSPEEQDELWRRTKAFMQTLKDREILDPQVTPQNLLYRLFNEDGVWVYKLQPLAAGCRCSRARISAVLKSLPQSELLATLDKGKLSIHCEFCNRREIFTRAEVNRLYRKPAKRGKKR